MRVLRVGLVDLVGLVVPPVVALVPGLVVVRGTVVVLVVASI